MNKKEMKLNFIVNISTNTKAEITTDYIQKFISDNVKGLEIEKIANLKVKKDKILADIKSNLNELLFTNFEDSLPEMNLNEEFKKKPSEHMIHCVNTLETQLKLQKALNPGVLKLMKDIGTMAKAVRGQLDKGKEEKQVSLLDDSEETQNLKRIIDCLNAELIKSKNENEALNDNLNTKYGNDIYIKEIKKLQNTIEEEKSLRSQQAIENVELLAKVVAMEEELSELREMPKGDRNVKVRSKEFQIANETIKNLEIKNGSLSAAVKQLEKSNEELKKTNKNLELDLVSALEDLAMFEGATLAQEQRKKKLDKDKSLLRDEANKVQDLFIAMTKLVDTMKGNYMTQFMVITEKMETLKAQYQMLFARVFEYSAKLRETERSLELAREIKESQNNSIKTKESNIHEMIERIGNVDAENNRLQKIATQCQSETAALRERLLATERELNAANERIQIRKQSDVGALDIVQKVLNGINKINSILFIKMTENAENFCKRLAVVVPRMKQVISVQITARELIGRWKDRYEELMKHTVALNGKIQKYSNEFTVKDNELVKYKRMVEDLKELIAQKKVQNQECLNKIKELELNIDRQNYHINELEADNKMFHEIYDKAMKKQSEVRREIFNTNSKVEETLKKYRLLVFKCDNDKKFIERNLKRFFDKITSSITKVKDTEVTLAQRLAVVSRKLVETGKANVHKMCLSFCELKKGKTTSEVEIMKLRLEQEQIQKKLKKNDSQKLKLEQQAKQYEMAIKAKDESLAVLNAKVFELTKNHKTEEAKSTILENYLQESRQRSAVTISNIKTQFKLDCVRLKCFMMDNTSCLYGAVKRFIDTNSILDKIGEQCMQIDILKKNYIKAKQAVEKMGRLIEEQKVKISENKKQELTLIEQISNEKNKTKKLEEMIDERNKKYEVNITDMKSKCKIYCTKLYEKTSNTINRVSSDIHSSIAKQYEKVEEHYTKINSQFKTLKEEYNATKFKLENDTQTLKKQLELNESKSVEKDTLLNIAKSELNTVKERLDFSKEEVIRLTEELNLKTMKLKEAEERYMNTNAKLMKCTEELESRTKPLTDKAQRLFKVVDNLGMNINQVQRLNAELGENKAVLQETQVMLKKTTENLMRNIKCVDNTNFFEILPQAEINKQEKNDTTELSSKLANYISQMKFPKASPDSGESKEMNIREGEFDKQQKEQWKNDITKIVLFIFDELRKKAHSTLESKLAVMSDITKFEHKIFTLNKLWTQKFRLLTINHTEKVEDHKPELEELKKKFSSTTKELETLKMKYKETEKLLKSNEEFEINTEARFKLSQSVYEAPSDKKELETLTKRMAELRVSKDKIINEINEKCKKQSVELKTASTEVGILKKEIQKLRQEIMVKNKEKDNLASDLATKERQWSKEISQAKKIAEEQKKEAGELQLALDDMLKAKEQALLRIAKDHEKEMDAYIATKVTLEKNLNEKAAECKKLADEHKSMSDAFKQQLDSKAKELEKVTKENKIKMDDSLAEINGMKMKCTTLEELLKTKEEEIQFLKEEEKLSIGDHRMQLTLLLDESAAIKSEYEQYKAKTNEILKDLKKNTEKPASKTHSQYKPIKAFFQTYRKEVMEISKKLRCMVKLFASWKSRIAACKAHAPQKQFLTKIVQLCTEFVKLQEDRVALSKAKLEKLNIVNTIMKEYMDASNAKDKEAVKAIVAKNTPYFPYFKSLDFEKNFRLSALLLLKIIEHKSGRSAKYTENNNIELNRLENLKKTLKQCQSSLELK